MRKVSVEIAAVLSMAVFLFKQRYSGFAQFLVGTVQMDSRPTITKVATNSSIIMTQHHPQEAPKLRPMAGKCTSEQLELITEMLPDRNKLQDETACPDPTWMTDGPWLSNLKREGEPLVAIYVGCNKGMNAVDTLRMFSHDTKYDKPTWKKAIEASIGGCGQHDSPQFNIKSESQPRPAHVHCIEAMPSTYYRLEKSTKQMGWSDTFHVHHRAMADSDGVIAFPNARPGTEYLGVYACNANERWSETCQNVPKTSLDSFAAAESATTLKESWLIDFLSVDTEGSDWLVLKGAPQVLSRTKYLEFEHHIVGEWQNTNLSTAIDFLIPFNFVCYWAGADKLWRITECYRNEYNSMKGWSNVACANLYRAPELAHDMEKLFLRTLER
eukprot:CAMPEP_0198150336 /NCGR_PEP_ID=MMETSP1443-20131203/50424_1 /TAXON_ID=186043 /ORGANISM="Entomoneis sp., Strain CCMP2396" /LENGTH=383 /DNA_ID=CAMNT_0043815615 /DNA_START=174 /DNA_END=1321 /DNA_ORIENTATION=-